SPATAGDQTRQARDRSDEGLRGQVVARRRRARRALFDARGCLCVLRRRADSERLGRRRALPPEDAVSISRLSLGGLPSQVSLLQPAAEDRAVPAREGSDSLAACQAASAGSRTPPAPRSQRRSGRGLRGLRLAKPGPSDGRRGQPDKRLIVTLSLGTGG